MLRPNANFFGSLGSPCRSDFTTLHSLGRFILGGTSGSQPEYDYADCFAKESIDRLPIFQFDFVTERREASLRADRGVEYGLHCQIGIQIRTKRTIGNTFLDQLAEDMAPHIAALCFQFQQTFHGPVTRIHRVELCHEPDLGSLVGEFLCHVFKKCNDFIQRRLCARIGFTGASASSRHDVADNCPDNVIFLREVLIHRRRLKPARRSKFCHGYAVDAALYEKLLGSVEDTFSLPLAMSRVRTWRGFSFFTSHRAAYA